MTSGTLARVTAASLAVLGCRGGDRPPPEVPGPLASALLAFAAEQGAAPEAVVASWRELESIAQRITVRRRGAAAGETAADSMNAVIFGELAFARDVESTTPEVLLLPSVVSGRKGGCVGLSALYLVLAERLDLPLVSILVPGHLFVRQPGPPARNLELLRAGEAMPDQWYRTKYGPWDAAASAYLRPLTVWELVAVHWFNTGNRQREEGNIATAAAAYRRAVEYFPGFAEAAANTGALDQLKGDLQAAEASYRSAARARADLPGLARNLSLLESERETHPHERPPPDHQPESGLHPRRSSP